MQRLTLLIALLFMTGIASAELSRSQRIQRFQQVMDHWRSGSKIWVSRVELGNGDLANLYLQFPNKFTMDNDRSQDFIGDGKKVKRYSGSSVMDTTDQSDDPIWFLTNGVIGENVLVEMAVTQSIGYYGEEVEAVVLDLVSDLPREESPSRVRVYIRASGAPEILKFGDMWMRDFRQETPKKNPFERSAL